MDNISQSDKREETVEQNMNAQKLLDPSELDYNNRNKKENSYVQNNNEEVEEKLLNLSNLESASDFYKSSNEITTNSYQDESKNILNIKETAKNIIQDEKPKENIADLLVSETEERENKFLIGIKKDEEITNVKNNLNFIDVEENEPKYKKAREKINKELEIMQTEGLKVYKEESDFGNTIQIIIRIEK